jgi:purine nucleosidase
MPAIYIFSQSLTPCFLSFCEKSGLVAQTGHDFMVGVLASAGEPVTLMVTGPLTTVAVALEKAPEIEAKIKKIVWMGGALNVAGNVEKSLEPG